MTAPETISLRVTRTPSAGSVPPNASELWPAFFPPGSSVIALPDWNTARLFVSEGSLLGRWTGSRLYPAFRPAARLYRLFVRILATSAVLPARTAPSGNSGLWTAVAEHLPWAANASLLVGTPGPGQKLTLECRDTNHRIVGYAKYAGTEVGIGQLRQEAEILSVLPAGVGPKLIAIREWRDGLVLLTHPVDGRPVPAALPPPSGLPRYLRSLMRSGKEYDISSHPWMKRTLDYPEVHPYVSRLASRSWPVVIQHGDLAAWNLRAAADGSLCAFDWEYGTVSGLPYLDAAHFVLQHQALIVRGKPEEGCRVAAEYLRQAIDPTLSYAEADAFARLTAFDACLNDPSAEDAPLQQWRRSLWRAAA